MDIMSNHPRFGYMIQNNYQIKDKEKGGNEIKSLYALSLLIKSRNIKFNN